MSCLRNVLFWVQILTICVAFGLCGVGITAVDDWLVYDAIDREKISLFRALAVSLAVCAGIWVAFALASRMFTAVRENDPDVWEFDGEDGLVYSPRKPR